MFTLSCKNDVLMKNTHGMCQIDGTSEIIK